jgi:MoxR-like ATPase
MFASIESLQQGLFDFQYVANRELATTIYLSLKMKKPLFLEGEAGVGKTEVGKVLAKMQDIS